MKLSICFAEIALPVLLTANSLVAQEWQWQRDDLVLNPSGLDLSNAISWAWGDLDGDGFVDVLIRESRSTAGGRLLCYRGGGFSTPPYWVDAPELVEGMKEPETSQGISLADLDGDGVLNLITREQNDLNWRLLYWTRDELGHWTADTTVFLNLKFEDLREADDPFFANVDADDDFDMVISVPSGIGTTGIRFFENVGTPRHAAWREDSTRVEEVNQNPPGFQTWSATILYADADSLLDLAVAFDSEGYFYVAYCPGHKDSTGLSWSGEYKYVDIYEDGAITKILPVNIDPNHRNALLILQNGSSRLHARSELPEKLFDADYYRIGPLRFGAISSAILFDLGNDGKVDLLAIGHFLGFMGNLTSFHAYQRHPLDYLSLWRNTHWFGTPTTLGDVQDFKAQLVDIDGNSRTDFAVAAHPYYFLALENSQPDFPGEWKSGTRLVAPFVYESGSDTTYFDPNFADLDGDGDVDLLIAELVATGPGTADARYRFFENRLGADTLLWLPREDWSLGLGDLAYEAVSSCDLHGTFADLDNDGDADLIFGAPDGSLTCYENIGIGNSPVWQVRPEVFAGIDAGEYANPSFYDFDGDDRLDLLVGNRAGELFYFHSETIVGIEENLPARPRAFSLKQNHPNPFNAGTVITYEIPRDAHVELRIYDLLGRVIETLVNGRQTAGTHRIEWRPEGVASGLYLCELRFGDHAQRRKLLLLK